MIYETVVPARFLSRPNRFIAEVSLEGTAQFVHVKNTGRCRELLRPGSTVYLSPGTNPDRKTKYDLFAVEKERHPLPPLLIHMDSQMPNHLAAEWLPTCGLFSSEAIFRREVTYGASRFDFYIEDGDRRCFLEVKGVTLEHGGVAKFPDAPTLRGVKHLRELIAARQEGYEAYVLFVIQMKGVHCLRPNDETHPAFGEALREAAAAGVRILARDCLVTESSIVIHEEVPLLL